MTSVPTLEADSCTWRLAFLSTGPAKGGPGKARTAGEPERGGGRSNPGQNAALLPSGLAPSSYLSADDTRIQGHGLS